MLDAKEIQDKLILELFSLVEQSVQCKRNIETSTNSGQLHLAKSRYIQGAQTVAVSKLPTENSSEFKALKHIEAREGDSSEGNLELTSQQVDKENGFFDPLRWFGILIPRSLQLAQEQFNKALEYAVDAANVNLRLNYVISSILMLRNRTGK